MPHSIQWYIEGQVLFARFRGVMTVEDVEKYIENMLSFYAQTEVEQIHCIIDARYITKSLNLVDMIKVLQKPVHPRAGWNVQIDNNQIWLRQLTNVVTQIFHIRSRSCTTFDEGLSFLASQDDTIRWERANLSALNPDNSAESN